MEQGEHRAESGTDTGTVAEAHGDAINGGAVDGGSDGSGDSWVVDGDDGGVDWSDAIVFDEDGNLVSTGRSWADVGAQDALDTAAMLAAWAHVPRVARDSVATTQRLATGLPIPSSQLGRRPTSGWQLGRQSSSWPGPGPVLLPRPWRTQ